MKFSKKWFVLAMLFVVNELRDVTERFMKNEVSVFDFVHLRSMQ